MTTEKVLTKKVEELAAGAMRLAMERHGAVKPFPQFCQAAGNQVTPPAVHEGAKKIRESVPSHMLTRVEGTTEVDEDRMIQQIKYIADALKISQRAHERSNLLVRYVLDKSLTNRKHPRSVPSVCVYVACESLNEPRTQLQVSQAANISEGTLRTILRELRTSLIAFAGALGASLPVVAGPETAEPSSVDSTRRSVSESVASQQQHHQQPQQQRRASTPKRASGGSSTAGQAKLFQFFARVPADSDNSNSGFPMDVDDLPDSPAVSEDRYKRKAATDPENDNDDDDDDDSDGPNTSKATHLPDLKRVKTEAFDNR